MSHRYIIISALLVVLLFSFKHSKESQQSDSYNSQYVIADIPGLKKFLVMTKSEEQLGKKLPEMPGMPFANNRSTVTKVTYVNQKQVGRDAQFNIGLTLPCQCFVNKDTLHVSVIAGLFSGIALEVNKNAFKISYGESVDGELFKADLTTDKFSREIEVDSKYQSLIFKEKPSFKAGQQLIGLATYTSKQFYLKDTPTPVAVYVSGKFYFTCKTRNLD